MLTKRRNHENIFNIQYSILGGLFQGKRQSSLSLCQNHGKWKTSGHQFETQSFNFNVLTLLKKIFNVFDGWVSAFYYIEVEKYSKELDYYINRQLFLALRKFEWKFASSSKGVLPNKYRNKNESPDCLSDKQRQKSGIPTCAVLLTSKRAKKNDT